MDDWILAIDVGTTSTVAATRCGDDPPGVLEVDGDKRIPSVVFVTDDARLVSGRAAAQWAATRPDRSVRHLTARVGDSARIEVAGLGFGADEAVGALLAPILDAGLARHGSRPSAVRLTYPAWWGAPRQRALLEAAHGAGLPCPALVPAPVAAALAAVQHDHLAAGELVLVVDAGGGSLDLALLRVTPDGFELAGRPSGDPQFGSETFDLHLADIVAARGGSAVLRSADPVGWAALLAETRRAKELLSTQPSVDVTVTAATGPVTVSLTRRDLDELAQPGLLMVARLAAHLITNAGLEPRDLAAVVLAGAASRAPGLSVALEDALPGVTVTRRGDPKSLTVLGATDPRAVAVLAPVAEPELHLGAAALPTLVVIAGPDTGRRFVLGGRMEIGRSPTAAISLSDPALSRRHALVTCTDDTVFVEDAGSRNGTAVDGEPVTTPRRLALDDLVEMGASLLRFEVAAAPAEEADPTTPFEVDRVLVTPVPAPPKLSGRADAARAADIYRAEVAAIAAELRAAARQEGSRRERRSPGVADVLGRAERGESSRVARPHLHPEFLSVRIGWGETSVLPRLDVGTGGDPGLRSWAMSTVAAAAVVPAAPIVISLEASPLVVVTGDAALAADAGRWLMAQVVALHRPHDVAVRVATDDPTWGWLRGLPHVVGPADEADPAAFTVTLTDRWPLAAPHGHEVPAMSTVVLVAPSVPDALPDGAVTLTYEPRPARVVIDGVAGGAPVMADVLGLELARTLGTALARQAH